MPTAGGGWRSFAPPEDHREGLALAGAGVGDRRLGLDSVGARQLPAPGRGQPEVDLARLASRNGVAAAGEGLLTGVDRHLCLAALARRADRTEDRLAGSGGDRQRLGGGAVAADANGLAGTVLDLPKDADIHVGTLAPLPAVPHTFGGLRTVGFLVAARKSKSHGGAAGAIGEKLGLLDRDAAAVSIASPSQPHIDEQRGVRREIGRPVDDLLAELDTIRSAERLYCRGRPGFCQGDSQHKQHDEWRQRPHGSARGLDARREAIAVPGKPDRGRDRKPIHFSRRRRLTQGVDHDVTALDSNGLHVETPVRGDALVENLAQIELGELLTSAEDANAWQRRARLPARFVYRDHALGAAISGHVADRRKDT